MGIQEIIKSHYYKLSKGQRRVATFFLEKPEYVSMHTAAEVGKCLGVSETTVIRCCYSLSFDGYNQLQKFLKEHLIGLNKSSLGEFLSAKQPLINRARFYEQTMSQDAELINETSKNILQSSFSKATKLLHNAEVIYIIGFRSSFIPAQWLYFTLNLLRPNVKMIHTEINDLFRSTTDLNENAVLLAFSFHRYWEETINFAEISSKKGARIIAITDSDFSPITRFSTIHFKISQKSQSTIDAMPAVISFINTLVAGMTAQFPEYYEEQIRKYDEIEGKFLLKQ